MPSETQAIIGRLIHQLENNGQALQGLIKQSLASELKECLKDPAITDTEYPRAVFNEKGESRIVRRGELKPAIRDGFNCPAPAPSIFPLWLYKGGIPRACHNKWEHAAFLADGWLPESECSEPIGEFSEGVRTLAHKDAVTRLVQDVAQEKSLSAIGWRIERQGTTYRARFARQPGIIMTCFGRPDWVEFFSQSDLEEGLALDACSYLRECESTNRPPLSPESWYHYVILQEPEPEQVFGVAFNQN